MANPGVFILSPHIDDAAYGLAIHIAKWAERKIPVTIINCFTDTNWTICFISKEKEEICRLRKAEDIAFNRLFESHLNIINLDLLDAPLRGGFIFKYKDFEELEWATVNVVREAIHNVVPKDSHLFCPLAIGDHIDHVICLEAIKKTYGHYKVSFFEDLPYSARINEKEIKAHVLLLQQQLGITLQPEIAELADCKIDKEHAVRLYRTQLNDEICAEIMSHSKRLGGERIWKQGWFPSI